MEVKGVMFLINKESINIYVLNVLFRSSPTQRSIHVDNEPVWNHCHHSASTALKGGCRDHHASTDNLRGFGIQ